MTQPLTIADIAAMAPADLAAVVEQEHVRNPAAQPPVASLFAAHEADKFEKGGFGLCVVLLIQSSAPEVTAPHNSGERLPSSDAAGAGAGPVIDSTTSGLQTGSTKPENLARLEKSKTWLRDYRAGKIKPETAIADGESE